MDKSFFNTENLKWMKSKSTILILIILTLGVIYKLIMTSGGNFLFNMDNARDMVDVREMVVLKKIRLIGPTSAIDGFYNGPFWYYLLTVPFIISNGNPYSEIIMEIILWAIGGFFLLKIVNKWNSLLIIPIGLLWIASDFIILLTSYAFNPNPIPLLTPLIVYLMVEYIQKQKIIFAILVWFLGGLFFNFEMNFGIFIPAIFIASLFFTRNTKILKNKYFWLSGVFFLIALLPQLFFDIKHQFVMSKSILRFVSEGKNEGFPIIDRIKPIATIFYNVFKAMLINNKILAIVLLAVSLPIFKSKIFSKKIDVIVLVAVAYILIPFIGYLIIPVSVNPWHLGGVVVSSIILIGFILFYLSSINLSGKIFSLVMSIALIILSIFNLSNYYIKDIKNPNMDTSLLKNEIAAIDYVYKYASGQNFKVYTYLPSVYDYPYQYLIWWYGKKTYNYIPKEYVYSPNKPQYIPSQDKFQSNNSNPSKLVFLIKEPDRINMRQVWENDFKDMEFISKTMVGSIEIEIRKEL